MDWAWDAFWFWTTGHTGIMIIGPIGIIKVGHTGIIMIGPICMIKGGHTGIIIMCLRALIFLC